MLDFGFYNLDCMEGMKEFPDKYFDLAIVDPEYGIGVTSMNLGEGGGLYRAPKTYKRGDWDSVPPDKTYFIELMRVSKNQIIWGGNHFELQPSRGWVFWDKNNGSSDFSDGELAWTCFDKPLRKFTYTWSGFIQGKMGANRESRIHPTQKTRCLIPMATPKLRQTRRQDTRHPRRKRLESYRLRARGL